jgi:hypothetical protein
MTVFDADAATGGPSELTPTEFFTAVHAGSVMRQLLQLDQLWTREAALDTEPPSGREERVRDLQVVVDEMGRLLEEGQCLCPILASMFDTYAPQVRARFEAFTNPSNLTDEGRSAALLTAKDQRPGNVRRA